MTITSEMLAAYAEGKVSGTERDAIRKYLADNPSELHTVAMMMDEDYDLDVERDGDMNCDTFFSDKSDGPNCFAPKAVGGMMGSIASPFLCMSAVSFVSQTMSHHNLRETPKHPERESFSDRLDSFMDELEI